MKGDVMAEHYPEQSSRRDLVKKAAVAGAVVWASPAILSSSASAVVGSGTCPDKAPCKNHYVVRFDGQLTCIGGIPGGQGHAECRDEVISTYGAVPPGGCAFAQVVGTQTNPVIQLAPGFTLARVFIKQGTDCFTGPCWSYTGKCGVNGGFEYGDEVIVSPGQCTGSGWSNVYAIICGP